MARRRPKSISMMDELARLRDLPKNALREQLEAKTRTQRLNLAGTTGVLVSEEGEWGPFALELEEIVEQADFVDVIDGGRAELEVLMGCRRPAELWGVVSERATNDPERLAWLAFYVALRAYEPDRLPPLISAALEHDSPSNPEVGGSPLQDATG